MDNKLEHAFEKRQHQLEQKVEIAQRSAEKKKPTTNEHENQELPAPSDLNKKF